MNSPLQEMKMWPQEVNPLRLGKGEEGGHTALQSSVKLNASVSFVWVIVGGIS